MNNSEIILEVIKYFETNIKSGFDVSDLVKKSGYSVYHFIRIFAGVTGVTPKVYINQRILSQAALEIIQDNKKILTVAIEYGFGSPENFSKQFKKYFNISPAQAKNNQEIIRTKLYYPFTDYSLKIKDYLQNASPEIVEMPSIIVGGYTTFLRDCNETKILSELWGKLSENIKQIKNRKQPEKFYQIQYWMETFNDDGLFFMTGLELDNLEELSPSFSFKILPATKYLRFIHKGRSDKVGYTYQFIYEKWLPQSEYRPVLPYNFEYYGPGYKGPYDEESESEIYIPVQ